MTRIALIGPVYPFRGGIAHYNSHLSSHLTEKGIGVRIFSFRRQYPSWLYPGTSDRDPSSEPLQTKADYILDPIYPWTWGQCATEIIKYQPNLVIIPWWTTFWGPAFTYLLNRFRKKGIHTVVLIHNVFPHETKPWDKVITRIALGQTKNFIVQTAAQQKVLQQLLPSINIRLAPHPIYDEFPGERIDKKLACTRLNIPSDQKTLLFMGIIRKYKGLHQLIDAIHLLKSTKVAIHLIIAGEFWRPIEDFQEQIAALHLQDNVTIYSGYIPNENVPLYFSAADLFVAPYTGGTQSGMVKLAMGFGTPVLISRQITDEILEQLEGNGVTFSNIESPEILAKDISTALSSKNGKPEISIQAKNGWDLLITQILSLSE